MKHYIPLFALLLVSCARPLEKPKRLVAKKEMSEIIAEFAVNDQLSYLGTNGNAEGQTLLILKKHGVTGTDFSESYKYYFVERDLDGILKTSEDLIKEKDPAAGDYIEKKIKEKGRPAPFTR